MSSGWTAFGPTGALSPASTRCDPRVVDRRSDSDTRYPQLMNEPACETGSGPQLVTWGKSTICSVDAFGYNFQWTTNSSKHIPFDWTGP